MTPDGSKRLLKADAARGLGPKVAFNYEDFRRRCDEYLEQVRAQARSMIEEAERRAEVRERQIFEEANRAGRAEGLREAERHIQERSEALAAQSVSQQLETALPAFQKAAEALGRERDRWIAQWEAAAVKLSIAVAERIIRRQIGVNPSITLELITEALQLASGSPHIKLRLNPDDFRILEPELQRVLQQSAAAAHATVVADDSITSGGCVAETQHGTVDARLETQLERIADELLEFKIEPEQSTHRNAV